MTETPKSSAAPQPDRRRRARQVLALLAGGVAVGAIAQLANTRSFPIAELEVAASAAEASRIRAGSPEGETVLAIAADFWLIGAYVALLVVGLAHFPGRAYRVRAFRRFAGTAVALTCVAGALDVVEDVAMLVGLRVPGDLPWQVAAVVAWPKFLLLLLVAGYLLLGAVTYLTTPAWLVPVLQAPPEPNLRLDADEAARPEPHLGTGTTPPPDATAARFGIAASGGGIRSASLVLGTLQALDLAYPDRESPGPSWSSADKVTSVSGGSYVAGALSIARSARRPVPPGVRSWSVPDEDGRAWRATADGTRSPLPSPEERRLLGRLGYLLAPNPAGRPEGSAPEQARTGSDVPGVVALVAVGLALNLAVLLVLLWLLVTPYGFLLDRAPLRCEQGLRCALRPQLVLPVVVWALASALTLLAWVGAGWALAAVRPGTRGWVVLDWLHRHLRPVLRGLLLLTVTLLVLLLVGPALVAYLPAELGRRIGGLTPAAALAGLGALATLTRGLRGRVVRFAPLLGGGLFVLGLLLAATEFLATRATDGSGPLRWVVVLAVALLLYLFVSGEWWSLAGFYRARLRLAFATYRDRADGSVQGYTSGSFPPETAEPSLRELARRRGDAPAGSPLQICATAHASGPEVKTHYGIPALSVTLAPDVVRVHVPTDDEGGWAAHQSSTEKVERLLYRRGGPRLTTMLAVGVSGAALSPAMGLYRIGPARALLAAANVRLGVWLPNPRYAALLADEDGAPRPERPATRVPYPRPRLSYLLKEMFGVHDIDDLYLYVTDGGHWENTGLVELLRDRTIDEVVCLDADENPRETVAEIAAAVGLARLECNVNVQLGLDPLRGRAGAGRGGDYSAQSVAVGLVRRGSHLGLLWYAKPVLTAGMPPELLSYAECDREFPATSTVDQFFHTAKFAAYRDLGRWNGEQIVEARVRLLEATEQVDLAAFQAAAEAPDAHWAARSLAGLVRDDDEYRQLAALLRAPSSFARTAGRAPVETPAPSPDGVVLAAG